MTRWAAALVLAAIAGGLVAGALGASVGDGGIGCVFRAITGVDCPFCGMTHATVALGGGDLRGAHAAHPLAVVVLIGVIALLAVVAAGRGERLLRGRRPLALLAVLVAVWAARLVLG